MRVILSITAIAGLCLLLISCEASKGAGKDIENTGKNIQKAVEKNQ